MDWKFLFFSFQGRIGRQSFWIGAVVFVAISIVAAVLDLALGTANASGTGIIGVLVSLALIYPGLALAAKRWHDRDKSAWWILISLIPIVGWIWALVENGFLRGTNGPNRFGPDPLGDTVAATA